MYETQIMLPQHVEEMAEEALTFCHLSAQKQELQGAVPTTSLESSS